MFHIVLISSLSTALMFLLWIFNFFNGFLNYSSLFLFSPACVPACERDSESATLCSSAGT